MGRRVLDVLQRYVDGTGFLTPAFAYTEVAGRLPTILVARGIRGNAVTDLIEREVPRLQLLVEPVPLEFYGAFEPESRARLRNRDESDWPYLALALAMNCPLWTEDRDFFGTGIATWTIDRVELYLKADTAPS